MTKDESFIYLMAFRYSMDRKTYAPATCAEQLALVWNKLDKRVQDLILMDLGEYFCLNDTNTEIWKEFERKVTK